MDRYEYTILTELLALLWEKRVAINVDNFDRRLVQAEFSNLCHDTW